VSRNGELPNQKRDNHKRGQKSHKLDRRLALGGVSPTHEARIEAKSAQNARRLNQQSPDYPPIGTR
jgi:hypothetical protein